MKTKHTLGPWTAHHGKAGHNLVSVTPPDNSFEYVFGNPFNARLIAAAPELLDACNAPDVDVAHDRLSDALEEDRNNDEIRDAAIALCLALNDHHEKRKAAIKKATFGKATKA